MEYKAAVITISDKSAQGLRTDTSGPAVCKMLTEAGFEVVKTSILPDDFRAIRGELIACADDRRLPLVVTTGGTGFSDRDVTPEATLSVIEREARGIPEAMRLQSMSITPRGCLSRSVAGIRRHTLIINLPGSEKAALENLGAVLDSVKHGLDMLLSGGSANCAQTPPKNKTATAPSLDGWILQAKSSPNGHKMGMLLSHRGVVRSTPRATLREGAVEKGEVKSMMVSVDRVKMQQAVKQAESTAGIYCVRVWLNEGVLGVGDDIMQVLVGGDIRENVIGAFTALLDTLKGECITEYEEK